MNGCICLHKYLHICVCDYAFYSYVVCVCLRLENFAFPKIICSDVCIFPIFNYFIHLFSEHDPIPDTNAVNSSDLSWVIDKEQLTIKGTLGQVSIHLAKMFFFMLMS